MVLTKAQREAAKAILNLLEHHEVDGRRLAEVFEELPPRKDLPDYYQVIKNPMALGMIKVRAKNGKYAVFNSFLHDLAQIFHNAKTYNKEKSIIFTDAVALESLLNDRIMELKEAGTSEIDRLPTIGDLPINSDDDDDDVDEDDDEAQDRAADADELMEEPRAKRLKMSAKDELAAATSGEDRQSPVAGRKRGRPPRVETPDESRMKNIVRAIKRVQKDGDTIYEPFEKLPDGKEYPDYYQNVAQPMSIAVLRKNLKRKVYSAAGIDVFIRDVKLIFNNAKQYNEDGSELFVNATYMLEQLEQIIQEELNRPDSDYINMDQERDVAGTGGIVKLVRKGVDKILQRGESYAIGDWIYLENPNQPNFPIIAQIFKTWQNSNGEYWINACWYYRPHQTVHRADKLWYEQEVVKTGQYRDHPAHEIAGHCYVMYVTKYVRGRPKEWSGTEENLYVCEARYNEELKTYNRIKAWKSCVPDESREESSNYELIPYDGVRQFPKVRTPLLHLMPENKKLWVNPPETEDKPTKTPEPNQRGSLNAPPIEGNVIVTSVPTDEELAEINNIGPPKQPSPESAPIAPVPQQASTSTSNPPSVQNTPGPPQQNKPAVLQNGSTPIASGAANETPQVALQNPYTSTPLPVRPQYTPAQIPNNTPQNTATPYRASVYQPPAVKPAPRQAASVIGGLPQTPAVLNKLNSLGPQINPTAYTVPNSLGLSTAIKDQLLTDEKEDIIWFTVPPQDPVVPYQRGRVIGHTARYLAWKIERQKMLNQDQFERTETTTVMDSDVIMQES